MIIFLDKSLVTSLDGDEKSHGSILGALMICAQQAREGVHLLLADRATFHGLEMHYSKMDQRTVATLRRSSEKLALRKQIRDFVTRAIRLVSDDVSNTPKRTASGNREEILLPASAVDGESSLVGKPLLMVENLNDGHAYLKLAKSIAHAEVFSEFGWLSNVSLHSEIVPGGGHTLDKLFAYHKARASRIGLAIADGDYRYPGGPMGPTAKLLQKAYLSAPSSVLLDTIVLSVRAIENCIPRAEISRITSELDPEQVARFTCIEALCETPDFWGVVPLKTGVRCIELGQPSAESRFWTGLFGQRQCAPTNACPRKQDCSTFVLHPITDKLLSKSVSNDVPFRVTANCLFGVEDTWRALLLTIYSLFCGTARTVSI